MDDTPRPTWPGLEDEPPGRLEDLETAAVAALLRAGRLQESVDDMADWLVEQKALKAELAETEHLPLSREQLRDVVDLAGRAVGLERQASLRVGHHALFEVHLIRLLQEQTQAGALGEVRQLRAGAQADLVASWRLARGVRRNVWRWVALGVALGGWATVLVGGVIAAVVRG